MHSTVKGTSPSFVVADLARSVEFYVAKLGYRDASTWGEPPCFAMMHRDGFDLMLTAAKSPADVHPNGPADVWDLYVKVLDLKAEEAALRANGVAIVAGPRTTFYNMSELEVLDPDGYRICFGQDLDCGTIPR